MLKEDLDLIFKVAENLKIQTLKADNLGIDGYIRCLNVFQITNNLFQKIFNDKPYKISDFDKNRLQYQGTIEGLSFYTVTNELLFEGDEEQELDKVTETEKELEDALNSIKNYKNILFGTQEETNEN